MFNLRPESAATLVLLASMAIAATSLGDAGAAVSDDEVRAQAVAEAVAAFESYGAATGNYVIDAGKDGRGFFFRDKNTATGHYSTSIANRLIELGHLGPNPLTDPNLDEPGPYSPADFKVLRCGNRVAVFSQRDAVTPSTDDASWWAANDCPTAILTAHPYFQLSQSIDLDARRSEAVAQAVAALEAYGTEQGTYRIDAGKNGQGFFFRERDTISGRYATSIANRLIELGHLDADPLTDPNLDQPGPYSAADFKVVRCAGRFAIFSQADRLTPSTDDMNWWLDNDCSTASLHARPFFQLSRAIGGQPAPTPVPEPTSTPEPTATPEPTSTPEPLTLEPLRLRFDRLGTGNREFSAVTLNEDTNRLIIAENDDDQIFEFDLDANGDPISPPRRTFELNSSLSLDTEGVAWIGGETYVVVDEDTGKIVEFDLAGSGGEITEANRTIATHVLERDGSGLEGVAHATGRLSDRPNVEFLAVLESPPLLYFISDEGSISSTSLSPLGLIDAADVSISPTGVITVVSDESQSMVDFTIDAANNITIIRVTSLTSDAGFFSQAEGVVESSDGQRRYIVGESKTSAPRPGQFVYGRFGPS